MLIHHILLKNYHAYLKVYMVYPQAFRGYFLDRLQSPLNRFQKWSLLRIGLWNLRVNVYGRCSWDPSHGSLSRVGEICHSMPAVQHRTRTARPSQSERPCMQVEKNETGTRGFKDDKTLFGTCLFLNFEWKPVQRQNFICENGAWFWRLPEVFQVCRGHRSRATCHGPAKRMTWKWQVSTGPVQKHDTWACETQPKYSYLTPNSGL